MSSEGQLIDGCSATWYKTKVAGEGPCLSTCQSEVAWGSDIVY